MKIPLLILLYIEDVSKKRYKTPDNAAIIEDNSVIKQLVDLALCNILYRKTIVYIQVIN